MADKITNAQQLQEVLDAIYNNRDQSDTYQNLTLYYDDISRTATIMAVDDEEAELPTKNIIAVFNPENVVTNNNAFFVTLMKSAAVNVSTEETSVYDFALGGYVNVDTLLKNICVGLGVSLSGTFADANPTLYSDMINIIRNEYGQSLENNAPYIMKKFVNETTQEETYKSLVPLMCIVRIAIYLNNLGIFTTPLENYNIMATPYLYYNYAFNRLSGNKFIRGNYYTSPFILGNVPTFKDYGIKLVKKSDIIDKLRIKFKTQLENYIHNLDIITVMMDYYETDIDFNNSYLLFALSGSTNSIRFRIMEFTEYKDMILSTSNGIVGGYWYSDTWHMYSKGEKTRKVYNITINYTDNEEVITNSKDTLVLPDGYSTRNGLYDSPPYNFSNLMLNAYIVPYSDNPMTSSSYHSYTLLDNLPRLQGGVVYDELKLIGGDKKGYYIPDMMLMALNHNNVEIGDNDLVITVLNTKGLDGYYYYTTFVVRDLNTSIKISDRATFSSPLNCSLNYSGTPVIKYDSTEYTDLNTICGVRTDNYSSNIMTSLNITFGSEVSVDIYRLGALQSNDFGTNGVNITDTYIDSKFSSQNITTDTLVLHNYLSEGVTSSGIPFADTSNNIGSFVEISEKSTIEGLNLLDGATYPKNVIDLNSFYTTYPNWVKTQSNNPKIVNGVLAPTVTSTQWGAVAISNTTPTSQSDADSGDIDFTDTGLVDDIIDDIDNATEDDDTGGGETEQSGTNGGEDSGSSPDIEDRTNLPVPAFIKVYALDEAKANAFVTEVFSAQTLINDPMQHILGLQVTEMYNEGAGTLEDIEIAGQQLQTQGYKITTIDRYVDINLGEIDIEPYFHNYLDITDTSLQIYLPYIGFIDLDIGDFLDRKIKLECRCDLVSGVILYTIKSIHTDELGVDNEQVKGTYSSNCQYEVPLNATSSFLKTIHNSFLGGGFQRLMASDW